MTYDEDFTPGEEFANAAIHGGGALLAIAALIVLIIHSSAHSTQWYPVSFIVYGVTLVFLFTMSTLFHGIRMKPAKDVFEVLDHSGVYVLIAGTYMPFCFVVIGGTMGWVIFGIMWGMTAVGAVLKIFFAKRFILLSTTVYIMMGCTIFLAFGKVIATLPIAGLIWLLLGGAFYTSGTVFYIRRTFRYHHAVWHSFALAGSICHFICIFFFVLPLMP
ncbi:MAG: hemolysin III family protein [Spirochaetota bacterium]